MRDIFISLFGEYIPVSYSVLADDGSVLSVVPSGFAGVDWVYVLGVVGFFLCLYCLFKIFGGLLSKW